MQFVTSFFSIKTLRALITSVALATVLFLQPLAVLTVSAQTVSIVDESAPLLATASAQASSTPMPSPSPESTALTQLREKYKTDLSIYRTDERDYSIAKEQYNKLQTLAALEVAVQATRKVMLSRSAVLQDYLQILRIMVSDTSGIDVDEKATLLKQLDSGLSRLRAHQQVVEQAIDRNLILESVKDFNLFRDDITNVSYKSLSYISYGRLQTVHDKMVAIRNEVLAQVEEQEENGLRLGEKRRAIDEIDRNLSTTKQNLDKIHEGFVPNQFGKEPKFESGVYGQVVNSLSDVYADLLRNLSFLREAAKT